MRMVAFAFALVACSKPSPPDLIANGGACRESSECASAACADGVCLTKTDGSCRKGTECVSGTCGGAGCDDATFSGRCIDTRGPCTPDIVEYCSCSNTVITGSSDCPPARYRHQGACEVAAVVAAPIDAPPVSLVADGGNCRENTECSSGACAKGVCLKGVGASCRAPTQCATGSCQGAGCGDTFKGVCADPQRKHPCTPDIKYFCTCEGQDTTGSSNCPPPRYRHAGKCNARR